MSGDVWLATPRSWVLALVTKEAGKMSLVFSASAMTDRPCTLLNLKCKRILKREDHERQTNIYFVHGMTKESYWNMNLFYLTLTFISFKIFILFFLKNILKVPVAFWLCFTRNLCLEINVFLNLFYFSIKFLGITLVNKNK